MKHFSQRQILLTPFSVLSGTFGWPWNSGKNVIAPYLAPVVNYLAAPLLARSRNVLKFPSKQGVYCATHGSKGENEHKQASAREALGKGILGPPGTGALDHPHYCGCAPNSAPSLWGAPCVSCRWVPQGSYVLTARRIGQNPSVNQSAPWGCGWRFSSKERRDHWQ